VFLVFSDGNNRTSINLKYQNSIYYPGLGTKKQASQSYQSHVVISKKNHSFFRQEFYVRVPVTLKTKDLANYKLVFVVYIPQDAERKITKITESLIDEKPTRFQFVPIFFAK